MNRFLKLLLPVPVPVSKILYRYMFRVFWNSALALNNVKRKHHLMSQLNNFCRPTLSFWAKLHCRFIWQLVLKLAHCFSLLLTIFTATRILLEDLVVFLSELSDAVASTLHILCAVVEAVVGGVESGVVGVWLGLLALTTGISSGAVATWLTLHSALINLAVFFNLLGRTNWKKELKRDKFRSNMKGQHASILPGFDFLSPPPCDK